MDDGHVPSGAMPRVPWNQGQAVRPLTVISAEALRLFECWNVRSNKSAKDQVIIIIIIIIIIIAKITAKSSKRSKQLHVCILVQTAERVTCVDLLIYTLKVISARICGSLHTL